jgi:hypothetical protein
MPCLLKEYDVSKRNKNRVEGKTSLPADRLVSSVGIGLLALRHRLANLDPNDWYAEWKEVVEELQIYSSLLAALHQAAEETLAGWVIDLPGDLIAVTAPNPFYENRKSRPSRKGDGVDVSELGDLPF